MVYSHKWIKEVILKFVYRILNNILRCSSLVMSDSGLLQALGSSHCRGQCEFLYRLAVWSSLPLDHRHDTETV